jgi:hypothetical protein
MSSTTTRINDVFQNEIEESVHRRRPSLVPRQISFTQSRATIGEIILILLPYFILIFDIFLFFLLRGFKLKSFDGFI